MVFGFLKSHKLLVLYFLTVIVLLLIVGNITDESNSWKGKYKDEVGRNAVLQGRMDIMNNTSCDQTQALTKTVAGAVSGTYHGAVKTRDWMNDTTHMALDVGSGTVEVGRRIANFVGLI
jgi:hypothetical protein